MGPRLGSEGLGLLEAEHQPLSSDGGRAFYSSHYHEHMCAAAFDAQPCPPRTILTLTERTAQHRNHAEAEKPNTTRVLRASVCVCESSRSRSHI